MNGTISRVNKRNSNEHNVFSRQIILFLINSEKEIFAKEVNVKLLQNSSSISYISRVSYR